MPKVIILTSIFFFYILSNSRVIAADNDIVINEIFANPSGPSSESNEFVELYNKGSNPVSITGWKISDAVGKTYTIPENTLPPNGFIAFRKEITKIALNNSGDDVTLLNSNDVLIDSMTYDETIEKRSLSRVPDGTGEFVNDTDPTEGAKNSAAPTPTPSPVPSPTPFSSTQNSTAKSPSPTPKTSLSTNKTKAPTSSKKSTSVLGKQTKQASPSASPKESSPSPSPESTENQSPSKIKVAAMISGAGAILIGTSLLYYLWYHKAIRQTKNQPKEEKKIEQTKNNNT